MPSPSPRPASKSSHPSTGKKRTPGVVGAVVGAVVGGVLGAVLVKKARASGAKHLLPPKVPEVARRAAGAVKSVAHDAKRVAKATASVAADAALQQVKSAAEQFVVDVVSGKPPTTPTLEQDTSPAASSTSLSAHDDAPAPEKNAPRASRASAPAKAKKKSPHSRPRAAARKHPKAKTPPARA